MSIFYTASCLWYPCHYLIFPLSRHNPLVPLCREEFLQPPLVRSALKSSLAHLPLLPFCRMKKHWSNIFSRSPPRSSLGVWSSTLHEVASGSKQKPCYARRTGLQSPLDPVANCPHSKGIPPLVQVGRMSISLHGCLDSGSQVIGSSGWCPEATS